MVWQTTNNTTQDPATYKAALDTNSGVGALSALGGNVQTIAASTTLNPALGTLIVVDTSGGPVTITLPAAPAQNQELRFIDGAGTFNTHNLTIALGGNNYRGSSSSLVRSTQWDDLTIRWVTANSVTQWR